MNFIVLIGFCFFGCHQNSDTPVKKRANESKQLIWASGSDLESKDGKIYLDAKLFSGQLTDSFPNGQVKYEKSYVNGEESGKTTGWHSNGNISYSYISLHGKREGLYQEYYPSGKVQIRQFYTAGKLIENKILNINGKVLVNYKYRDGRVYGLLGSSSCRSVYEDDLFTKTDEQ